MLPKDMTALSLSPFDFVLRAAIAYLAVLILLRVSGKRQVGQMGAVEFVTILLISNAVQNSMNGGDNSVVAGLILATVLVGISMVFAWIGYRSRTFSAIFEGTPRLVIHDIHEIKTGVLESDGSLSLIRYAELQQSPDGKKKSP